MTINREISQFASFVNVDDATKNIGIATTSTPSIGIGTANPSAKFEVVGNTKLQSLNVTGITTLGVTTTTDLTAKQLKVSGISTLGVTTVTDLTAQSLIVSGVSTFNSNIIQTSGLVGIGTDNPLQRFQIGVANSLGHSTDGKVFVVTSNADVGIGTTNPLAKLDVRGDVTVSGLTSTASLTVTGSSVLFLQGLDVTGTAYVDVLSVFPGPSTLAGQTNLVNALNVAGITTLASFGGITTTGGNLYVGDNLYVKNNLISGSISYSGVAATNFTVSETLTARRISIGGTATVGISFTDSNIRIGDVYTGSSITSGTHNNFIGNSAGLSNTTGNINNFIGN